MKAMNLYDYLSGNEYPGRGIVLGRSADERHMLIGYFIMGRSENSRNRVFVTEGEGIRTEAFDPAKLSDPSLIIYSPVRVLGKSTIVTNGDQTDTIYDLRMLFAPGTLNRMAPTLLPVFPAPFAARAISFLF